MSALSNKPSLWDTIYCSLKFGAWKLGESLVASSATWRCSQRRSWGVRKASKEQNPVIWWSVPPKVCVYMTSSKAYNFFNRNINANAKKAIRKCTHSQISTSLFSITPQSQTLLTFYQFVLFLRENLFQSWRIHSMINKNKIHKKRKTKRKKGPFPQSLKK